MTSNKLQLNGKTLNEKQTKVMISILKDRVRHPRKYDHVIISSLAESKQILRDFGFKGKYLN